MKAIGDDIWRVSGPDFPLLGGARLPVASTIVRLPDRTVLVYAPVAFDDATVDGIAQLGEVAHVVAPNLLHHRFVGDALARWPRAALHAPAGLAAKRSDLPAARPLPEGDASWRASLEVISLSGAPKLDETVLFHRPSATLICADLVFHVTEPANLRTRLVLAAMGTGGGKLAQSRAWNTLAKDRSLLRPALERVLALPIAQVAPCHGPHLAIDAASLAPVLARAYGGVPGVT